MRVEEGHAHARTRYELLNWQDYWLLFLSVVECKFRNYKSLTVHLPFEMQHGEVFNISKAKTYILFGEVLRKIFRIKLYWENAPWLNYGSWDLKYENTNWVHVPKNINLCLDTGHLMLGVKSKKGFLKKLSWVMENYGGQIKHLHLHENDFESDQHISVPGKVIDKKLFEKLIRGRSYIIEMGG
jgi:hypothetical protein